MTVRNALLGLLYQRPRHRYDLYAAFIALAGGERIWELNPAQVYTTLNRLEQAGLVGAVDGAQAEGSRAAERQVFALTPAGRAELEAWLAQPVEIQHQRDEFFLKLMVGLATGAVDPYRLIYAQRTSLYRQLHAATAQRDQEDPLTGLAYILLLERSIMHLEADLRWLDMIEARLDEIRRQPVPEPELRRRGRPKKAHTD
jgi:DNA-binding PadR family transcriptional regulator